MPSLTALRQEHRHLMTLVGRMDDLISRPSPPPLTELFQLRSKLCVTLISHLKTEDWLLYPRLLKSGDATIVRTAQTFGDEMGGLAQAYRAHVEEWTAWPIQTNWAGYCHDCREILDALASRIRRENHELYPLLEARDKAA